MPEGLEKTTAVILAAGQGTRMKSTLPKVLHAIAGRPLVHYPVRAALEAGCGEVVVVVGHGREHLEGYLRDAFGARAAALGQIPEAWSGRVKTALQKYVPSFESVTLKVGRETAGRRGKGVTTVFDLPYDEDGVRKLAALLKKQCGTGGTVKDGRIEIQGGQRQRIVAELERLGSKVKRVGG